MHSLGLSKDLRGHWMECDCPVWIVGQTPSGDLVPRQSTGCSSLKAAEAVRSSLISQHSRKLGFDAAQGPTIADCIAKYLASRQHELSEKTIGQHRVVLNRLIKFCEARGVFYTRTVKADLLETFKVEGFPEEMADTSKATAISKLRCFLRAAYRRDWIGESLVDKVTAHKAEVLQTGTEDSGCTELAILRLPLPLRIDLL
ncbi:MAG: phage integrase SAM-like domain-containing protein [Bryobacteraceae bacterium]